jgi:hypothetical protein
MVGFFCPWTHGGDLLQADAGKTLYLNFNWKVRKLLTHAKLDCEYGSIFTKNPPQKDYALTVLKGVSSYPERQKDDYYNAIECLLIIEKEGWSIPSEYVSVIVQVVNDIAYAFPRILGIEVKYSLDVAPDILFEHDIFSNHRPTEKELNISEPPACCVIL